MIARVTKIRSSADRFDEAARILQQRAAPLAQQMRGFRSAVWLGNRRSGEVLAIALYDDEAALEASHEEINRSRQAMAQHLGATVESVEVYEILAHAGLGGGGRGLGRRPVR